MAKYLSNIDLSQNQLLRARIENQTSDPSGVDGQIYYNSASGILKYYDGTGTPQWRTLASSGAAVTSVTATAPMTANGSSGSAQTGVVTVAITAASGSAAGSMSSTHYSLLNNATNTATNSTLVLRDSSGDFAAHIGTFSSVVISNAPSNPTDAANKAYVDSVAVGLDVKNSVRVASTANITVTYTATGGTSSRGQITAAPNTVDGVTLASGNRILLKDQTTGAQNGIWVVSTLGTGSNGVWDRATDFDADSEVTAGAFTFVEEGTANQDTGWVLTTDNPITIGGSSGTTLTFAQFSGAGQVIAGNGLTKSGNTLNVVGTSGRISVAADSIDIDSGYVGQTSITTLGTISTGTWSATTIAVNKGGTGIASYTSGNILYASGSTTLTALTPNSTGTKQFLSMTSSVPSWGVLVNTDIPAFTGATSGVAGTTGGVAAPSSGQQNYVLTGSNTWVSLASAGGVTSVVIGTTNGANSLLTASTSSGTATIDFATTSTGNTVLASPSGGGSGAPTFRSLVAADLPTVTVAKGGTGLTGATTNGVLYGASTTTAAFTAAGTQYQILRAGSGGTPAFGSIDLSQTAAVGTSVLPLANGGTNASSASGARTQLASDISGGVLPIKVAFNLGDGSTTAITVTHNLANRDLVWNIASSATPWDTAYADVTFPTTNTATVTFNTAPTTNQYRLTLIG